jgi:phosphinothricin acetyltransferase
MTTLIRDATERDLPSVLDIFNHEIITSTAVYLDHPTSLAERTSWWAGRVAAGYPCWSPTTKVE